MNFEQILDDRTEYANKVISKYLPEAGLFNIEITEAVNYSINVGGKRLRPVLINAFYRLFGGKDELCEPCMAALEMLHTYSLVHDDLPALDNDDYRRGMPTAHKKYGEAIAILSGDGLLHCAYETFIKVFDMEISENTVKALKIFADKTGLKGMLGGQSADVINTGREISDELMYYIYEKKTGAIIEGAMMIGAALAGCKDNELEKVCQIGKYVGMAFQIRDDILDVNGNEEELGKPLHSDEKNNKKTYIKVNGLEKSEADIEQFSRDAADLLSEIGTDDDEREFVKELIISLAGRKK